MGVPELNPAFISPETGAIVFDWDDTLVNCIGPKIKQHLATAEELKIELTEEKVRAHWSGNSFDRLLEILYEEQKDQALEIIKANYANYPKILFKDTVPTLSALGQVGVELAIMTSLSGYLLEEDLKVTRLDPGTFGYVQTQEHTTVHKPHGEVFDPTKKWLESVNLEPSQAIYVGDAIADMQAARAAGLGFVGIERGFVSSQQFRGEGALCISSLRQLLLNSNRVN